MLCMRMHVAGTVVMFAIVIASCMTGSAAAQELQDSAYVRNIRPLLKARCFACHGALKQEAGLRLDTGEFIRKGSENGVIVSAGEPEGSRLIAKITVADPAERMPPLGEPLTNEEVSQIAAWIQSGASSPNDEQPEQSPREHWSFRPLIRPAIPAVNDASGSETDIRNPVDAFIAAKHSELELTAASEAPKRVLLRRVTLDLIGLPPTREELHAFLSDESPDAHEHVVDRLLADPRYGERWGRHWMDIWRYADWYGRRGVPDVWNSAPQIWRWRDWIVNSLNCDKGYDRMIEEMLAADEICPEDTEAAVATGYLVRNWYALNPNDWMRNTVEHTGKAFLGLTFNCAHCHDHKYDPIAQEDYFRMRAFFEPMNIRQDRVPGQADPGPYQEYNYSVLRKIQRLGRVTVFDKSPDAPTWFYTGGDERSRITERGSIAPGVPSFLGDAFPAIAAVEQPLTARFPGLHPEMIAARLEEARTATADAEAAVAKESTSLIDNAETLADALRKAEAEFAAAVDKARSDGKPGALSGRQSLVLDATTGRRMIYRPLDQLAELPDRTTVRFLIKIVADSHFNFQLARDLSQGLTATFVGFEGGRVLSYQPGSFTEFETGRYDLPGGQQMLDVSLEIRTIEDRCLLTVVSVGDGSFLVDHVPVALNGWNPVGDPRKGILIDGRSGSVTIVDDVRLENPPLYHCDFESPLFTDGDDASGTGGWLTTSFSAAPATSLVSSSALNESLRAAAQTFSAMRRVPEFPERRRQAAARRLEAATAESAALTARIEADRANAGITSGGDPMVLIRSASSLERAAVAKTAEAHELAAQLSLFDAESKPVEDKERAAAIESATKQLAAARTAVTTAAAALTDSTKGESYTPLGPNYPAKTTGRRRALAAWITSEENPLPARVAVNHIWARHFHSPLVGTVFDFGRNGAAPTHPELLDWLACELRDNGWCMKHLHRLIVTSAAYRRSSAGKSESDPDNRWLTRMNSGRMEAEAVRDSLLYLGGKLDLTQGGQELENSEALTTFRRSLYYSCQPEADGRSSFGAVFDAADAQECYRRTKSIIPQQALALTNSELIHTLAAEIVANWQAKENEEGEKGSGGDGEKRSADTDHVFVEGMFEKILTRLPSNPELNACREFLARQSDLMAVEHPDVAPVRAREGLVRVLLNHNDFLSIR